MIIIHIKGGLGNQMFQYANGLAVSLRNNTELALDSSGLESTSVTETKRQLTLYNFDINTKLAKDSDFKSLGIPNNKSLLSKIRRRVFRFLESSKPIYEKKIILEPSFTFCKDILKINHGCYLAGGWQSPRYFSDIEMILRKTFVPKNELSSKSIFWIEKVISCNSVSVHVRRGDYVGSKKYATCTPEYYKQATKLISTKVHKPVFFIFSDDIQWTKTNLTFTGDTFYVSDSEIPDFEELFIMSKCRYNIIANSSFSWWGAWLNDNRGKIVIAPKRWLNSKELALSDLIDPEWYTI